MFASQVLSAKTFSAQNFNIDEDGFLVGHRQWSVEIAQHLAAAAGLGELTEVQWRFIDFARDRYFRLGALPPMSNLCRKIGVKKDEVKRVFGSCRALWQIAGLPNPGEKTRRYMN